MSARIGVVGVVVAVIAFLGPGDDAGRQDVGEPESPLGTSAAVGSSSGFQPTPAPSSAEATGPQTLIDIPLVDDEIYRGFEPGPLKVNAVNYADVYAAELLCYIVGNAAADEFQLDRQYARRATKVGLSDVGTASGIQVKFTVFVDGMASRSITATVGEIKPIDVSVSGALRVSLRAEILKPMDCGSGRAVAAWVEPSLS